jgi:hypothetical protein
MSNDIEDHDPFTALADQIGAELEQAPKYRKYPRYAVPWRIFIVHKKRGKREMYRGVISDLSLTGVSIFSEVSITSSDTLAVTIEIPPYANRQNNIVVGVRCSIFRSVLSSRQYGLFHILLNFIEFDRNGKRDLTEALSGRIPLAEYKAPYT